MISVLRISALRISIYTRTTKIRHCWIHLARTSVRLGPMEMSQAITVFDRDFRLCLPGGIYVGSMVVDEALVRALKPSGGGDEGERCL